ncbi:site-specific integrase [Bacillus sp. FJAT-22090]|uniref:tyrosine-type recombinase/integrase n=1 Tax=Bacillus sp. FJAT-22090 TaxID=1581038 RepID=UPI0011A52505|nr:site-specific integrase [Bacillus sp. FJAT-22090]
MSSIEELIPKKKYRLYVELGSDIKGKRIRKTRVVEANGPRKAEELLKQFENEMRATIHLNDENATFATFAGRWLLHFAEPYLDVATFEKYQMVLPHISAYFEKKKIREIQTFHVVEFFNNERKIGRGSLDAKYKTLKSIFKHAVKWQVIPKESNPMNEVEKPKEQKMRTEKEQFYTAAEIPGLLKLIETLQPHQRIICKLAIFGGLRRGEILGITKEAINWDKNQIHISHSLQVTKKEGLKLKSTKTEDERTVTLPLALMEEIKQFNEHECIIREEMGNLYVSFKNEAGKVVELLFVNPDGKPYRPDSVTQFWLRFRQRTKLRDVNFHGLRHSSASYLLSQGVNIKLIQMRLGHKDIKTTLNMYSHVTMEDDSAATEAFDKLF